MIKSMAALVLCAIATAPAALAEGPAPQAVTDARNACAADVQKLCAGVQTGGGRILACLKQHKDEVSDACKQAVLAAMQSAKGDVGAGSNPAGSGNGSPAPAPAKPQVEDARPAAPQAAMPAPQDSHASAVAAGGKGDRYFKMKQVQIIDQNGFASQMPAVTMMIPSDWKFEGKIGVGTGPGGCFADVAQVSFHAQSADGSVELEGIPGFSWQYADNPGTQRELVQDNQSMARFGRKPCPVLPPVSAADFLRKSVLVKVRPGKTVASVDPLPEFDKLIRARMGLSSEPGSAARAAGAEPRIDAARARLQYSLDGKPVEEWVTAVTIIWVQGAGRGANNYDCHGTMMLALRTPQGRLDEQDKLFKLIASTIRVEPKWQTAVGQFIAQLTQANQQRKATNKKAWDDFFTHAAQVTNGVTANMMAGSDASVAAQSQFIRQVQTYRNPDTGATFELSNQYNHAWLNGNNEYIMSDDHSFNPNSSLNGNWTELQPVKP